MDIIRLEDGRAAEIVEEWTETVGWNGRNNIGRYSRDQWSGADLGLTRTGCWVLMHRSARQGSRPWNEEISPEQAAGWFAACGIELPEALRSVVV